MEIISVIQDVFNQYGLTGIALLGVGILAYQNRKALKEHEDQCSKQWKDNRELLSTKFKEVYDRVERIDDKREKDKDQILKAINDRRIEEQGDMFVNALGKAVAALKGANK